MRLRSVVAAGLSAAALLASSGTASALPPVPSSMSSLGDSITKGFNACGWYADCPDRSWSTGGYTSVNSHYLRIRAQNSAINARNFNDSRSGAKMVDLNAQAQTAVSRGVDYVTILMGANDACTSTEAGMTPVATYRAQLDAALATIKNGLPNAAVFVGSVPDVKRLWFIGKDSSSARNAWASFKICQSMLVNPQSTLQADVDRRARVQQRVVDFNTQLAQACAAYGANCKYDNNAIFGYQFVLSQVSTWDYFHPNTAGQQVLANVSYAAGFGW